MVSTPHTEMKLVQPLDENKLPADIQYGRGQYYEHVAQEIKMAMKYYEMAAAQGHAEAQYRLAFLYHTGLHGVPQDFKKAVTYYKLYTKLVGA